jgi:hypothetical protein
MKVRNLIFAIVGAFLMVSFQPSFAQTTEKKPVKKVEKTITKEKKMVSKESAVKDTTKKVAKEKMAKVHHKKHMKEATKK